MKEKLHIKNQIIEFLKKYRDIFILTICAFCIGIITGLIDSLFGQVLIYIGGVRENYFWYLIPFLAVIGLFIVFCYNKFGKDSSKGMGLIFEKAQENREHIPLRLVPLVTISTWFTHLFGGSAGREGVAVQIGGTIGSFVSEKLKIEKSGKILTIAGMSAGFGGLFRTPISATFFAMEVITAGKIEISALLPSLVSAFTASTVSGLTGLEKFTAVPETDFQVNAEFIVFLSISGVIFGITGGLFAFVLGKLKGVFTRIIKNQYVRIAVVGISVSIMSILFFQGRYSGLGTNLINSSFSGGEIYWYDFALKFILTVITLAGGFQGGEVTPLFSIGASLGIILGTIFNMPIMLLAGLGYVAVFGSATNTFIAPIFIGAEVFGYQYIPYFVVVCIIAYIFNGNNCIYSLQKRD